MLNPLQFAATYGVMTSDNSSCTSADGKDSADAAAVRACRKRKRVRLNVGGISYDVLWKTLEKYPETRLGKLTQNVQHLDEVCDDFDADTGEFFFDHFTEIFPSVIAYHRDNHLHIPNYLCMAEVTEALQYWGVSEVCLESCCLRRLIAHKEAVALEEKHKSEENEETVIYIPPEVNWMTKIKLQLWQILEVPSSSIAAMIFAVVSIFFLVISTATLVLCTTEWFRDLILQSSKSSYFSCNVTNATSLLEESGNDTIDEHYHIHDERDEYDEIDNHPAIQYCERACIAWFTFELIVRFLACPDKKQFAMNGLNIIDFIAILPYYFGLAISFFSQTMNSRINSMRSILQLLRILRILRVFKVARHSDGLQALGYTIKHSIREVGMIMLFLCLAVLFFSTLIYYVEKDAAGTTFQSIPASFWFAAVSMTTVGYGDMTPTTAVGKIIGMLCCVCGVIMIALPIPIIVNNFTIFYEQRKNTKTIANVTAKNDGRAETGK